MTNEAVAALAKASSLQALRVHGVRYLTDHGINALASLTKLHTVHISGEAIASCTLMYSCEV